MLFSSFPFFLFFSVYLIAHFLVPVRYRLALIIVGSTIFYAYWKLPYVILPYALLGAAHALTLWMQRATSLVSRKRILILGLVILLSPLLFFKYVNFFANTFGGLFGFHPGKLVDFSLPLGISFVTFTLIAYIVDAYRREFPAEQSPARLAGCVLFFPHLIAGPIVRPWQLIPQFNHFKPAWMGRFKLGCTFFVWGLAKKVIFADPLAGVVDILFAGKEALSVWHYLLGIYGFSVQIYCDFSGYSDMALGLAYILGMRLPFNFNQPYTATSIIQFWHRWHITLSTWLRDYLYIPLGGNRGGKVRQHRNLLITMVLGGLWHGANVTFLIWGLIHGVALSTNHVLHGRVKLPKWLGWFVTFHIVTVAWIFFRAPDVAVAWRVLTGGFSAPTAGAEAFAAANLYPIILVALFAVGHLVDSPVWVRWFTQKIPRNLLWTLIVMGFLLSVALGAGNSAEFIYFEF